MHDRSLFSSARNHHPCRQPPGGFTLIEIMLTLALLGMLASIAIPYLQEHIRTAHRIAAQAALMQHAAQAEAHYSHHWSYHDFALDQQINARVSRHHTIELALEAQSYELRATPTQTDRCGTLRLTHDGRTMADADRCWP